MLDENLPTFRLRPSPESPSSSILYLTQAGSEPSPEYILRRADPVTHPSARGKYAAALCSASSVAEVIYGEVLVEPTWSQPSLSAAELRSTGGVSPPPVPTTPDGFDLMLYNPDYTVPVNMEVSTWTKSETWEFEMPSRSFRTPSGSQLDREGERRGSGAELGSPRVVFRWKRDGRLSKDMTCYLVGVNVAGKKSKEPDITIAMCKVGKESAVTIYEPNLHRVEVEDRKGLEVVLLLSAEVIRDLYLSPRQDVWNMGTGEGGRRKGSRTHTTTPPALGGRTTGSSPAVAMSGALGGAPPVAGEDGRPAVTPPGNSAADIDAETRRLQAMVEREEKERAKREKEEQKRIKRMLDEEERERQRREAEVAKETERLRKVYGVQGQDLPSSNAASPPLPPRPQFGLHPPPAGPYGGSGSVSPSLQPRPASAQGPVMSGAGSNNWYLGQGPAPPFPGPPPQQQQQNGRTGRTGSGGGSHGLGILNPAASVSQFFGGSREDRERKKVQKKRSMHW
ncbi:hypothetical protein DL546_007336 [Coniochaeta pulveracea]|uniref:Uncharacterized protein n=1 Tax=Coniochaeta pulveracea TaxID=177199 RepID=A0A420YBT9_9PEZI|nr:hypothetical protein DL546_007336 [Coniochaeta pulveracea]